jgi:hypothetical protein
MTHMKLSRAKPCAPMTFTKVTDPLRTQKLLKIKAPSSKLKIPAPLNPMSAKGLNFNSVQFCLRSLNQRPYAQL